MPISSSQRRWAAASLRPSVHVNPLILRVDIDIKEVSGGEVQLVGKSALYLAAGEGNVKVAMLLIDAMRKAMPTWTPTVSREVENEGGLCHSPLYSFLTQ